MHAGRGKTVRAFWAFERREVLLFLGLAAGAAAILLIVCYLGVVWGFMYGE